MLDDLFLRLLSDKHDKRIQKNYPFSPTSKVQLPSGSVAERQKASTASTISLQNCRTMNVQCFFLAPSSSLSRPWVEVGPKSIGIRSTEKWIDMNRVDYECMFQIIYVCLRLKTTKSSNQSLNTSHCKLRWGFRIGFCWCILQSSKFHPLHWHLAALQRANHWMVLSCYWWVQCLRPDLLAVMDIKADGKWYADLRCIEYDR